MSKNKLSKNRKFARFIMEQINNGTPCILAYGIEENTEPAAAFLNFALKKAVKSNVLAVLGILTLGVCFLGLNEIVVLFGCGFLGLFLYYVSRKTSTLNSFIPFLILQVSEPFKIGNSYFFPSISNVAIFGIIIICIN